MTERSERERRSADLLEVPGVREVARSVSVPDAPALLSTRDGTVVRATEQAARLAGVSTSEALIGRKLGDLIVQRGTGFYLHGTPSDAAVRPMTWPHHEDDRLRVTILTSIDDLVEAPATTEVLQLEAERDRLVEAQRIARVGSWVLYPETGEFKPSQVLQELFNCSSAGEPEITEALIESVHPEDREQARQLHSDVLNMAEGQLVERELRNFAGDRVFRCTMRALHGGSGRVERIQATVQDITEHHLLEWRLRDEQRKLHDAQRVARLGTWEWDLEADVIRLSDWLREIIDWPEGARHTYQHYIARVHADDRERVEQAWSPLRETGQPVEVEHRYVRGDGAVRILRSHGAAVADADGRTLLVGTSQDVTEQRAAVTRMERSSQRFTDLFAVAPVGIGLFDQAERLVNANDALCDLLGHTLEQLRGMTARDMTHPEERTPGLRADSSEAAFHGSRRKVPQRLLIRSDGEPVYCELHISMSVQDDGTRFWLVVFQDVTERRRAAEALRYQATHDELTGLPNRAATKDILGQLLSGPDAENVAVLFCDLDNFKRVNDSLGHDAGDELLVALARRLEGGLPDSCVAARLSGDEYVIICSDIDAVGGVDSLATRVSSLLGTAVPVHGQLIRVSASIGAAVANGSSSGSGDLLRFADAAMFEAKRRGVGKVSLAGPALMASADRQLQLEGQLREALNHDELVLHYQPVVNGEGRIISAEALLRWPHPERGLLNPGAFLPVAEQGDLLRELDRWVLRTALREAADWPLNNGDPVTIAVNLAGLVPGGADFVDVVAETVDESGIAWNRVVLELVETALVDLPSRTRQAMGELVGRGVRFAVDDFGTGYSSLARLKDLPAQIIKLDRRFVSGVGNDASDFAVARAVVDMARAMGRECVAEGVETATQFHVLSGIGVDAYQGWLFSHAISAEDFRDLLMKGPMRIPRSS